MRKTFIALTATLALTPFAVEAQAPAVNPDADKQDWIVMFNGKDLTGWTPKIARYELGDNYGNTFRVENGLLEVRYDKKKYPDLRGPLRTPLLQGSVLLLPAGGRVSLRRRTGAGRAGLGAAQLRRHAAFATIRAPCRATRIFPSPSKDNC